MQGSNLPVARFGVTIYFGKTGQEGISGDPSGSWPKRNGIEMDEEQLLLEANRWELNHGGMSGRTAQQFIDYLLGMETQPDNLTTGLALWEG